MMAQLAQTPVRPVWRRTWVTASVLLLGLACVPLLVDHTYLYYLATLALIQSLGAMGLHLLLRTGQINLGHAAFVGVGAYASSLLMVQYEVPWLLAMACGVGASVVLALVVGPIVLRLQGVYFILITFTFGEIVRLVFVEAKKVTGGSDGLYGIPPPLPQLMDPRAYYVFALVFAVLVFLLCRRILDSDVGKAMNSISLSEGLAETSGVNTLKVRIFVFAVACAIAALQGSVEAHFIRYISPLTFGFGESVKFLTMNIIGGVGSIWGAVIGAFFLTALPELLRGFPEYQWVFYGLILVLTMHFAPGGVMGTAEKFADWRARRKGAKP